MCGIAGIIRLREQVLPPPTRLEKMKSAISHRGPDGDGSYADAGAQIGMVRLAVIDPDGGRQPVQGCSPNVQAVYNGEIYNHGDLVQKLREAGHRVPGRCDSDVIPHLYEQHGKACVDHLSGMFALCVWDRERQSAFFARDRFGIKPLFFAVTREFFIFASEIKAIFASGLVRPEISRDSVDDLFSLTYPCPPRTMFRGVFELRPGHTLNISGERAPSPGTPGEQKRYYRVAFPRRGEHLSGTPASLAAKYRETLAAAVQSHMVSDVPLGAYLSGGLDSSVIAAMAAEKSPEPLRTLSIGFDNARLDETPHAKAVAKHIGSKPIWIRASEDAAKQYPKTLWHLELPLFVPVGAMALEISAGSRAAQIPVVLSGEGADELLGGYDAFRSDRMRRALQGRFTRWLRPTFYRQLYKWFDMPDGAVDYMLDVQAPGEASITEACGGIYPPWYDVWHLTANTRDRLLGVSGRKPRPTTRAPEEFAALVPENIGELSPLDAGLSLELETRLPNWILVIGDRGSMANSVELRVPFLDPSVAELSAALPPWAKMFGLQEKSVLRRAARGLVPKAITQRRKQPFFTPIREWFFSEGSPEYVSELMSDSALKSAELFEPSTVQQMRRTLAMAGSDSFQKIRLEVALMLVLGNQLLDHLFVKQGSLPE